jgi:7-cyano-7-deazaguanine synthase in queuosine biosynthesis
VSWHVIAHVGPEDDFLPGISDAEPRLIVSIDQPGNTSRLCQHLLTNVIDAGYWPNPIAVDLLNIALATYTADLRVSRRYAEDTWTRNFDLYVPVSDPALWKAASSRLTRLLSFLTGDSWRIEFRERSPTEAVAQSKIPSNYPEAVCLFSGGLDSYVGAIDLLEKGLSVALVGQYGTSGTTEQNAAFNAVREGHVEQVRPFWFYVLPPLGHDRNGKKRLGEDTMRSRSLLFLGLGTAVATAIGRDIPLVVPENGFISLNVPLTHARTGSSSTRTTHPYVLELFREVLSEIGLSTGLITPYRFKTKGEMLAEAKSQDALARGVHQTISCSRPRVGRHLGLPVGLHCGYCVPCIIRRAALKTIGMDDEPNLFDVTTGTAGPRKVQGADRRAFEMAILRTQTMSAFGLAAEVLNSGPIQPADVEQSVGVYRRGLQEVKGFLGDASGRDKADQD